MTRNSKALSTELEDLTSEQVEIIEGLLLGDGCVQYSSDSSVFPRLTINRSEIDLEYVRWQFEKLRCLYSNEPKLRKVPDYRIGKIYNSVGLISRTAPVFEYFRERWYPNGKKTIPKDLFLTPLIMAIWYCDDGHMRFANKTKGSTILKLSTDGFNGEDVRFLQQVLEERYHSKVGIYRNGKRETLRMTTDGCISMVKDIYSVFPSCMNRKALWLTEEGKKVLLDNIWTPRKKLSDEQVMQIRELISNSVNYKTIAQKFSISRGYVYNLKRNKYRVIL